MGGLRRAGLAVAGSLALTALVCMPAARAVPGAKPTATPHSTHATHATKKATPAPTVTKTTTTTATPIAPCKGPEEHPASQMKTVPWAQQRLDFTSVWGITRGKGVTVAVVDSGINQSHPQLVGRVVKSIDLTHTHNTDCYGHGTWVAGIIAAQDRRNSDAIPFVGVAPDVRLISIKIQDGETSPDDGTLLAKGIMRAVQEGADIINVSAVNTDYPLLRQAVHEAARKGVLIVASAGNTDPRKKASEQEEYPASYPGVLSVGAVGPSGTLTDFSNTTSKVDVTAPGEDIISTSGNGYVGGLRGTSYSTPYVAGVAALVKASKPDLTAPQLMQRIIATADRSIGTGSGAGMVNPHEAVTALVSGTAGPSASQRAGAQPIDIGGPPTIDHRTRDLGALIAVCAIGGALLVAFAGVIVPLGARRGWRPGRAKLPPDERST
ncbi:S8 family serine peptidase [Actinoallomurus purpureus]|uniref:S8 family serine peptidase n=1 Tax=Actinoallomurus purpureus TaxID=478114 RepID=UPI00209308C8|nr:S8 family serine peptidase [Actinoallomurus purpureus]MCO6011760.1 S8 family serine peptidase [Actinoallomurus purpureus]